jgi:MFS family permease
MVASNINKVVVINFLQRFHLYIHAYALLLIGRGLSLLQISLLESVVIGTIFLMEVPTGILADRIGRKWSIFFSTFFLMLAEFIFIFARGYGWYVLISMITGTAFAFASGAVEAMVYDSLPPEGREDAMKRAMGRVNSWGHIAFFISPIVGAFIIGDASPNNFIPAIALTVCALLIGSVISLTLQEPQNDWAHETQSAWQLFREGIAIVANSPRLRRLALLVIFTTPFTGALVTTFAPPYLTQHDVSPFLIGVVMSVGHLIGAFTQHYAYKLEQWLGQRVTIALLILLPGVLYWVLALVAGPLLTMAVIILMYGTNDMKAPLFSAYQNALISSRHRATVLSLINMFVNLFIAIVAPVYARIAQDSLTLAFIIMGAVIIAAGLLLRVFHLPTNANSSP